jgi:D-arabinose 1-dehydrogenase-like Zn-dependent alcohol dehydrogenase
MLRGKVTRRVGTGVFDLLLVIVKVPLDWPPFINSLAPNGRMHTVGVKFVPIIGE